jgi:hypothetical protein
MRKTIRGKNVDTVFVLIVFSIFAFSVLMVLMLGAGIYRNINDISNEGQNEHTALSYIWTKTKNFDKADSIRVGEYSGVPALIISEIINDDEWITVIYSYDGWLREFWTSAGDESPPEWGMQITSVDDFNIRETPDGLIEISIGGNNLLLSPRGVLNAPLIRLPLLR